MPQYEILAAASSWLNFEVLIVHVVLAHPRAVFHPCTCGLYRDTVAVAAALISYDDVKFAIEMTIRRR
jgi:hypothetical protein